jgi:hypothetical protein
LTVASRRHSARRVKRLRTYNVHEAAKATGATSSTVRQWHKNGLEAVKGVYPLIFRGVDLIAFFDQRNKASKQPCGPGRIFCLHCKKPKVPAFGEVEFWPEGPKLGTLKGLCPDCAATINRRTSLAKLKAAAGNLNVSTRCAETHLSGTTAPNSYPHSEQG